MNKKQKITFKINYKEILKGFIFSVFVFFIVPIGFLLGSRTLDIFAALMVTQVAFAFLWLFVKLGLFNVSSIGFRKLGSSIRNARSKSKRKNLVEQKKNNKTKTNKVNDAKSKQGIYLMLIIGFIEFLSTIWLFVS